MKKGQIISLFLGATAIAAGALAYTAAKMAGANYRSAHDGEEDKLLNTPYKPDASGYGEQAAGEQEAPEQEPEARAAAEQLEQEEPVFDEQEDETLEEEIAPDEEGPADLEEYIELNPGERENLEAVKNSFAAEGVSTEISFSDNTMFFDFVMTDVEDKETREILKPDLEQFLEDQAEAYQGVVKQIEEDTGFDDIRMIVIFMDANGEEIVSGHYDDNGRTM